MQYRTILLHLNDEKRVGHLIKTATTLSRSGGAHVIGLYVMPSAIPPPDLVGPFAVTLMEDQLASYREQGHRIKLVFDAKISEASNITHEWRIDDSRFDADVADAVINHARTADLVIVSQAGQNPWIDDVPERVALESGRPVLVLPQEGDFDQIGKDVAIAWKPTKEATRAVFDALPILKGARRVRILTVNENGVSPPDGSNRTSSDELASSLLRHGVHAETETVSQDDLSVANRLLVHTRRTYQDLIVMGVYGHSRFREFILGGVSRDVLQHTKVPVLLAH
ncbi:universal stress protein [Hyphomicrobium sp. 99]|uniref:universal stress protein n=1 Tax=Hyphomicrobium sp. 99 TaxID=1163419 RepID=UPI0005F86D1F|nr:universal stress protein [Hyphomicrobium sp. 99]